MSSFDLNWTPAGGLNSTAQQVQYKAAASPTWLTAATVSATENYYLVEDLAENTIYDFRIVNLCSYGGPAPGGAFQTIDFVCPESVTITPTYNSVGFSFTHVGGSVDSYRVDLLNAAGSSILAFKNISSPSGTVADSFTGLSSATNYRLRVTLKAGSYSEQCSSDTFSTAALPTCDAPTGLTVVIDEGSDGEPSD